jgi:ribosome-associated translation inhibitor RaiA
MNMKLKSKDFPAAVLRKSQLNEWVDASDGWTIPRLGESHLQEERIMQIQVNTDHNIEGHQALADQVTGVVERALNRISEHITRVEVHLSDVNGDKSGPTDKRCMMEARLEGRQPVAVTHQAATLDQAVDDAADKLTRLIESTLGRRSDRASRRTDPPPPGLEVIKPS